MTLKVFTAFSGYDSQCMALDRMKINYELVGWSEIDKYAIMYDPINNKYFRIRKLTEKACFRLMDVSDENINKIQNSGISKTQQYKMAGNSIVVNVLYFIFKNLFKQ